MPLSKYSTPKTIMFELSSADPVGFPTVDLFYSSVH